MAIQEDEFALTWEIEVHASNPVEAAQKAVHYMNNGATVFNMVNRRTGEGFEVDLKNDTWEKIEADKRKG